MAEADPQKTFNVHEAKTHLSKLMDRAHSGEEIVLAKAGEPWAKIVPISPTVPNPRRTPGGWPELATISWDVWDEPLSEQDLAYIDDRPEPERH